MEIVVIQQISDFSVANFRLIRHKLWQDDSKCFA